MEKKTPLYNCHLASGGKPVPFAGYLMCIQYGAGIIAEHNHVREKAGLFDVSHMGELMLTGPDALANVQRLVTNDCANMVIGQIKYSPMCNERGGIVDDLMVHKCGDERYLLVVNASNRHKDVAWIKAHLFGDVVFEDLSDSYAEIAIQGPAAPAIIARLAEDAVIPQKYYSFVEESEVGGIPCLLAKTGYTGELGYELYCANDDAERLWNLLLETGKHDDLIPCGLGCRDTLRLEAAMPLYGHEMNEEISPIETGLGRYVAMDKGDFIGKQALIDRGDPTRTRVGLQITGRGIAREEYPVVAGGREVGFIMSGGYCPTLGGAYATAFIDLDQAVVGNELAVMIRQKPVSAVVVPLPFYKRKSGH